MEECQRVLDEVFGVSSSECNDTAETSSTSSMSPQPRDVELKREECCLKSMEEYQQVLEDVFGASECNDTDEVSFPSPPQSREGRNRWEMVKDVKGLWLCRQFLTSEQQSWVLSSIEREGWFSDPIHNQAMRFGDLPEWATNLSNQIFDVCSFDIDELSEHNGTEYFSPLPVDLLFRKPLFDQLIANVYQPNEGIRAHIDLMKFEDFIAIISLQSSCVMHFTRVKVEGTESGSVSVPVLLTPGSLVIMSGEARYLWKHEINRKTGFQVWDGMEMKQQRRTSITLRKICPHHLNE